MMKISNQDPNITSDGQKCGSRRKCGKKCDEGNVLERQCIPNSPFTEILTGENYRLDKKSADMCQWSKN
ncbi:hypothetical protein CEXT_285891 [Caerostris extrusa]|uniref:Uncharacterized protein n=1 Tax=Caerostris extrusa TaxID=172846 RepID=A0AAV4UT15_CAEEX|nr:hypothetical protein CEXT_285891 [Caerostris extrusa]